MKEIIAKRNDAGQRMDKLLAKYLTSAPKSFIYKMLRKKNITLNDKKATGNEKIIEGDSIKIYLSDDTYNKFSGAVDDKHSTSYPTTELDIVYEDDNVIFLNKPAGMLSQKSSDKDLSINEYMIGYLLSNNSISSEELKHFKPSVCNRLDRNTSGLITAGKSLAGLQILSNMFKDRNMDKYYLALVAGNVKHNCSISGYLKKDDKTNKVTILKEQKDDSFQPIETEYYPVSSNDNVSLIKVKLITGKTHQIRAHLSSIGHPIVGDAKYGSFKINKLFKEKYGLKYQLLHSYELSFCQVEAPLDNLSNRTFRANLSIDFVSILKAENILLDNIKEG